MHVLLEQFHQQCAGNICWCCKISKLFPGTFWSELNGTVTMYYWVQVAFVCFITVKKSAAACSENTAEPRLCFELELFIHLAHWGIGADSKTKTNQKRIIAFHLAPTFCCLHHTQISCCYSGETEREGKKKKGHLKLKYSCATLSFWLLPNHTLLLQAKCGKTLFGESEL